MEKEQAPENKGKYASRVDSVLHAISLNGWANESSGNVEAPTGYFSKIIIDPEELAEIADAFEQELAEAELEAPDYLIGNWILFEDSQGFVESNSYETRAELHADYSVLLDGYQAWLTPQLDFDNTPTEPEA